VSAYAFLTTHKLSVVDRFFADIRTVPEQECVDRFIEEVRKFGDWYDDDEVVGDATQDLGEADEVVGGRKSKVIGRRLIRPE